jgi:hypothetical protein
VARLAHKHGKGKALTIFAHKLARAVYYMLRREHAFDGTKFFHSTARRGGSEERPSPAAGGVLGPRAPMTHRAEAQQRPSARGGRYLDTPEIEPSTANGVAVMSPTPDN